MFYAHQMSWINKHDVSPFIVNSKVGWRGENGIKSQSSTFHESWIFLTRLKRQNMLLKKTGCNNIIMFACVHPKAPLLWKTRKVNSCKFYLGVANKLKTGRIYASRIQWLTKMLNAKRPKAWDFIRVAVIALIYKMCVIAVWILNALYNHLKNKLKELRTLGLSIFYWEY